MSTADSPAEAGITTAEQPVQPPFHPLGSGGPNGAWIYLKSLRPDTDDYYRLYDFETNSTFAPRWRLRGETPPYNAWLDQLGKALDVRMIWSGPSEREAVRHGIILAHDTSLTDGVTYISAAAFNEQERSGEEWPTRMTRAFALFVQHLFCTKNVRKIYLNVPAYNLGAFTEKAMQAGFLTHEATMSDLYYYEGSFHAMHLFSITRERWFSLGLVQDGLEHERQRQRRARVDQAARAAAERAIPVLR